MTDARRPDGRALPCAAGSLYGRGGLLSDELAELDERLDDQRDPAIGVTRQLGERRRVLDGPADPSPLDVRCPRCDVELAKPCEAPDGRRRRAFHAARWRAVGLEPPGRGKRTRAKATRQADPLAGGEGVVDSLILGSSEAARDLRKKLRRLALSPAPVLLLGETGTGKSLAATCLHLAGPRSAAPLVEVEPTNEALLESELFGHEAGAFTGAAGARRGKLELAEGGTLVLEEIGDASLAMQVRLLRFLDTGRITRLGGEEPIAVDARVVAATLHDLPSLARAGRFRADLVFRLGAQMVRLPPLRERREDIEPIALAYLARLMDPSCPGRRLTARAMAALRAHDWPGNIRDLEYTVRRAAGRAADETIEAGDVEAAIDDMAALSGLHLRAESAQVRAESAHPHAVAGIQGDRVRAESAHPRDVIVAAVQARGIRAVARAAGCAESTLRRRLDSPSALSLNDAVDLAAVLDIDLVAVARGVRGG